MTVTLLAVIMCRFCGLHSEIEIRCSSKSIVKERVTVFRQMCDYCDNKGEHIVTEIKGTINAKEKIIFT